MPFGLTNKPATFQRLMNNLLPPVIHKCALVYLDDVIIYSRTIEDHMRHIQCVLNLLREGGLKIKLSKCLFLQKAVKYLGHNISEDRLRPDQKLPEAITNYTTSQNKNHVKSLFLIIRILKKACKVLRELRESTYDFYKTEGRI
jgi:hypothetical protein